METGKERNPRDSLVSIHMYKLYGCSVRMKEELGRR